MGSIIVLNNIHFDSILQQEIIQIWYFWFREKKIAIYNIIINKKKTWKNSYYFWVDCWHHYAREKKNPKIFKILPSAINLVIFGVEENEQFTKKIVGVLIYGLISIYLSIYLLE